jgi:TIR domain
MAVAYQIYVIQSERTDWLAAIRQSVAAEIQAIGMHRSVVVDVTEDIGGPMIGPAVAVFLAGPNAVNDEGLAARSDTALRRGVVVLPVLDNLDLFATQVPLGLARFNAFQWSGPESARKLARLLLEELGIEDRERSVFLSHKRSDGLGAAEQLHDRLSHFRFEPFIDRFAIRPGEDVQSLIADFLERYAFLLILETPDAHLSAWVYDEVDYALSHTMGTLILQWPNGPTPIPGSIGIPRFRLTDNDLARDGHGYDVLTEDALDRVIEAVEAAHANGLTRRRRMLVSNVEEAARAAGGDCVRLKNWALDVATATRRSIVAVAPRLPATTDLHRLDETRNETEPTAEALLVHAARRIEERHLLHLGWVTGTRDLTLVPENAIGAHW